jgi:hypothetical protein
VNGDRPAELPWRSKRRGVGMRATELSETGKIRNDPVSLAAVIIYNICALVVLSLLVVWEKMWPEGMTYYCGEDRIIESLTAVFFFFAGIAMFVTTFRHPAVRRRRMRMVFLIAWSLLFLIFAGEEISWGQRIFGLPTPELLKDGMQDELNIHNLKWVDSFLGGKFRWLSILVLTTGVFLPLLSRLRGPRRFFAKLTYPVVQPHYIGLFLGGYLYCHWLYPEIGNPAAEIREFLFSLGYMLFAIHAAVVPLSAAGMPRAGREGEG